jgi:hypothetical protein
MVVEMAMIANVNVTIMGGRPFSFRPWDRKSESISGPDVCSIAFTLYPVESCLGSRYEFVIHHPNALVLDVGALSDDGLTESWLSCQTDDAASLSKWKELAKILKRRTACGAVALNPQSGDSSRMRNHRYSAGAEALSRKGVPMRPIAGVVRIEFGKG